MSRKTVIALVIGLVLVLGVVGTALAYQSTPLAQGACPFGGSCGGFGTGDPRYGGAMSQILADVLGMTAEQLEAALDEGQTVSEIAAAQGVELADVVTALMAAHVERLQEAVAAGTLTQERADWMIEQMTEQMTWRLQNPSRGFAGLGGGCGMMGGSNFDGSAGMRGGMRGGRWGGFAMPHFRAFQGPSSES
jgi:hypothetical protein